MIFRRTAILIFSLALGLLSTGLMALEADNPAGELVYNPQLRAFFEREAMEVTAVIGPDGRRYYRPDAFLDERVDRMVLQFTNRLFQKRLEVNQTLAQIEGILLRRERHPEDKRLQQATREGLLRLEDRLKDLRSTILPPLEVLGMETEFKPGSRKALKGLSLQDAIQQLNDLIARADRQIEDYFFRPTHTVTVSELTDGNMLLLLHQAQYLSAQLARR